MKKYNSLKIVQTFAKIGKVLSKVVYIFCIVGFCLSIVGIVSLAAGITVLKFGDVTLGSILDRENISDGTLYTTMALACVACVGEAVLAKFAEHYFANEIADGTPFTEDGANEMLRLGIIAAVMPVAISIVCGIMYAVFSNVFADVAEVNVSYGSVATGAVFILMSFVCRLGAEQKCATPAVPENVIETAAQQPDTKE